MHRHQGGQSFNTSRRGITTIKLGGWYVFAFECVNNVCLNALIIFTLAWNKISPSTVTPVYCNTLQLLHACPQMEMTNILITHFSLIWGWLLLLPTWKALAKGSDHTLGFNHRDQGCQASRRIVLKNMKERINVGLFTTFPYVLELWLQIKTFPVVRRGPVFYNAFP